MEAGRFVVGVGTHLQWIRPKSPVRNSPFPRFVRCSAELQASYRGPKPKKEWIAEWVSNNDDAVRSLPIYVGGGSLLAVLVNRTVSGIAPVVDASSSQSRADLLTLGLAVTNILAGLVWLSIRPKTIFAVGPQGVPCQWISPNLQESVISELSWVWDSLSVVTCCRSLVIVYNESCVLQMGIAAECTTERGKAVEVDANKLMEGSLYRTCIKSQTQSYLANLSLYPGRSELPFLPSNTQAVILQPLGDDGIAILGGDTVRGFTTSDQAWITLVAEKIEASLRKS
ncbi:unnamed protein product [Rhodiola kirilowii]